MFRYRINVDTGDRSSVPAYRHVQIWRPATGRDRANGDRLQGEPLAPDGGYHACFNHGVRALLLPGARRRRSERESISYAMRR